MFIIKISIAQLVYTRRQKVPPRIEEDSVTDLESMASVLESRPWRRKRQVFYSTIARTVEDFVDEAQNLVSSYFNPQWRVTDDWFDGVSRTNVRVCLQYAQFLGGKGGTLRRLWRTQI
jgi:hypothetical protein